MPRLTPRVQPHHLDTAMASLRKQGISLAYTTRVTRELRETVGLYACQTSVQDSLDLYGWARVGRRWRTTHPG